MSLTSLSFLLLVAVSVPVYYVTPARLRWAVLLLLSWGFYLGCGAQAAVFLLGITAVTYGAGLGLGALNRQAKEAEKAQVPAIKGKKRLVVLITLLISVGLLVTLKFGHIEGVLAPLGISFYTFQSLGYVIDCYRGKYAPQRNLAKYALFVSFFPQLTQGPIGRYDALSPQLTAERPFDATSVKYGIQLMMWGYMKKLIIADRAAVPADAVFAAGTENGGLVIAFGVLMYCIQLYCDFSGGIDIVRGVAKLYGIDLAENFRRPLFAQSLTDYWRRWHMTLGQWMKDYVFYSMALSKPILKLGSFSRRKLGGRVGKLIPTSVCTFTIYFIIGIWHGGGSQFIAYGLYNGIIITASLLLEGQFTKVRRALGDFDKSAFMALFRTMRTMGIVFVGRYLTRSESFSAALRLLKRTLATPCLYQMEDGTLLRLGITGGDYMVIAAGVAIMCLAEWYQERGGQIRKTLEEQSILLQWLGMVLPLLALAVFGLMRGDYIQAAFIYQQY